LRQGGFRVISSQATLDTVLDPKGKSRVRFGSGKERPFGWTQNPKFNAVITYQFDPNSQDYLRDEIRALKKFVKEGGGLIIIGEDLDRYENMEFPINMLAKEFKATFTDKITSAPLTDSGGELTSSIEIPDEGMFPSLSVDDSWKVIIHGADKSPIMAIRDYGKGRIAVISDVGILKWGDVEKANGAFLHGLLYWLCENQTPVGGSRNLPSEAWGGGAIYPDQEIDIGGITVFYAKNQKKNLLEAVKQDMPEIKEKIEAWIPSAQTKDRMYLILSSGDGGGWAVNIYEPKEVGIISLEQEGIMSIFAHELAHTMWGPPNDKGEIAGRLPDLFSEAHAGWFQGKVEEMRTGEREGHEPNRFFAMDEDGKSLDITKIEVKDKIKGWTKLWWIFQKLDERYGTVWYPRWIWVKNMRWADEPDRDLSWDDVVEDMSIAVGEDLFPFFCEIGTTLEKNRFPEAEFSGKMINLPIAPLTISKTGKARLEEIGDYKEAINIGNDKQ